MENLEMSYRDPSFILKCPIVTRHSFGKTKKLTLTLLKRPYERRKAKMPRIPSWRRYKKELEKCPMLDVECPSDWIEAAQKILVAAAQKCSKRKRRYNKAPVTEDQRTIKALMTHGFKTARSNPDKLIKQKWEFYAKTIKIEREIINHRNSGNP